MTSEFIDLNQSQLHYESVGVGPALILIHAGIADMRMWDDQIAEFSALYEVVRYDVRGYGLSPNPEGTYHDYEMLAELLDRLGVEKTALLGCSMGGNIAVDFTLAYPERVTALITVGSGLDGFEGSDKGKIKQMWAETDALYESGDLDACADRIVRMWCDGPARSFEQVDPDVRARARVMALHLLQIPEEEDLGAAEALEPRALERLAEIGVPTLVMVGDNDFANQIEFAHLMAKQVPNARLVVIEDAAHLPNMEKPKLFNQLVLEFLAGVKFS